MVEPLWNVIIPHFNDPERLKRALDLLLGSNLDQVEIIVADNGSSCDLSFVTQHPTQPRLVIERKPGAAHARNKAVQCSDAPFLAFLDADCVPLFRWLDHFRKEIRPGQVLGGKVSVFHETLNTISDAQCFESVFAFDFEDYIKRQGFTGSGNMAVTRLDFIKVGEFRAGVSEDKDWSNRARARGIEIKYLPQAEVGHPSREDWKALKKKWRRVSEELYGLQSDRSFSRIRWAIRAAAMPLSIIIHIPKIVKSDRLRNRDERMKALRTLIRLRFTRMVWMLRQALSGQSAPWKTESFAMAVNWFVPKSPQ